MRSSFCSTHWLLDTKSACVTSSWPTWQQHQHLRWFLLHNIFLTKQSLLVTLGTAIVKRTSPCAVFWITSRTFVNYNVSQWQCRDLENDKLSTRLLQNHWLITTIKFNILRKQQVSAFVQLMALLTAWNGTISHCMSCFGSVGVTETNCCLHWHWLSLHRHTIQHAEHNA